LLASWPQTAYLTVDEADRFREAHTFLRSLEMMARMDRDANVNWIGTDPVEVAPLGVRMGFSKPAGERLLERYHTLTGEVRRIYLMVLERLS
jgi:glutamine synthetase adenylyltransferase